jgi:hypothetical protein
MCRRLLLFLLVGACADATSGGADAHLVPEMPVDAAVVPADVAAIDAPADAATGGLDAEGDAPVLPPDSASARDGFVFNFDVLRRVDGDHDDPASPDYLPTEPTILPPGSATPERIAECHACEERNRGGLCNQNMGCDGLTGEDLSLCQNLRACLRANPVCNTLNPVYCYCGNHIYADCSTMADGPCLDEALAAAKTTNVSQALTRFWNSNLPSGHASQVSACHIRACRKECLGLQL